MTERRRGANSCATKGMEARIMYTTEPAPFGRRGTVLVDENGVEQMTFVDGDHATRAAEHAAMLNETEAAESNATKKPEE